MDITYFNVLFIVENNLQNQAYRGKLYSNYIQKDIKQNSPTRL
jgi:hypothetical protein